MAVKVPTSEQLMNPLIRALQQLGGSGSIEELYDKVVELEKFSDDVLAQLHNPKKSNQTEVAYRLAWARTFLKKYGLLENSARGVWSLNQNARELRDFDPQKVMQLIREPDRKEKETRGADTAAEDSHIPEVEEPGWKQQLHVILTEKLSPAAFERLVQRVLRESGFTQVEVTGQVGDGGIDGRGIARVHGLMSFHVLFQCKRYKGSVGSSEIRDFRGAMTGRTDKGLFITTGTFSHAAMKEARRDGAPPIDLLDGNELAEKLKELKLGVSTKNVEVYSVDEGWFSTLGN